MFLSLWVTALLPSAKEAIKFHLNPRESQAGAVAVPAGCVRRAAAMLSPTWASRAGHGSGC